MPRGDGRREGNVKDRRGALHKNLKEQDEGRGKKTLMTLVPASPTPFIRLQLNNNKKLI